VPARTPTPGGATLDWVEASLASARIRRRGPITHVRTWARSTLWSIETDHGRFWVKQVPPVFAHEVAVTALLTDVDPGSVAPAFATDVEGGCMITVHVDGPSLEAVVEPGAWTATLARLAELQRVLAADPVALEVAGVASAPVDELAGSIERLIGDERLTRVGKPDGLNRDEVQALGARTDEIRAACEALAATGVPDSLDHGDLSARQVIVGEMGPVILDWSDGSVTHPFLSAAAFLDDPRSTAGAAPRADLVDAYLGQWVVSGAIGLEAGRRAIELASMVLPVHVARLCADRVLPGLGWPDDPDVTGVAPAMLRRLR
jgi:Phosphotransferase enzyme family